MKTIYLDANAATRLDPEVLAEMMPFLGGTYGNASSAHILGREAKKHIELARRRVAALIGADLPEEIMFTSGGTEADNAAIISVAEALRLKGNHIITSSVEHPAVLNTCRYLEKKGYSVTYLKADKYGMIDPLEVKDSLTDRTILITVMTANNETGTIMPIREIKDIAREREVLFHTDAVQAAGKIKINDRGPAADMISLSGHKMNGPKGVGALYVKKGITFTPFIRGGHQENGKRAGTENTAGIVGMGKASENAREKGEERKEKVKRMRDRLYGDIKKKVDAKIELNGHPSERLHNTLNVSFEGVNGESLVLAMDLEGVCISTGSACTSGSQESSHVLKAMGLDDDRVNGAVRFSLDHFNTDSEIEEASDRLKERVARIRDI